MLPEQVLEDYEEIFFGNPFCDCDEDTRRLLAGIIIQHLITQEQVEVLWALTKDVDTIKRAAHDLDRGLSFPDNDLAELCEWVRRCKNPTSSSMGFTAQEVAEALRVLGKAGLDAVAASKKLQKAMEKLNVRLTPKSKQNNRPARLRKKHVFKATDNTSVRPILSEPHRGGHVYQRRS